MCVILRVCACACRGAVQTGELRLYNEKHLVASLQARAARTHAHTHTHTARTHIHTHAAPTLTFTPTAAPTSTSTPTAAPTPP